MIIEKMGCNILATTQRGSQKTQTNIIIILFLLLDRLSRRKDTRHYKQTDTYTQIPVQNN